MAAEISDDLIDDDILEIFVEEAEEVLEAINEQFPVWRSEPGNAEVRLEVRRAFHTLKGSGRMVRAAVISELAWSIENMINRITDGTINACDAMFDLIEQVRGVLPALIKAFEGRAEAPVDVTPMMQCAEALARGEQPVALDPAPAQIAAAAIVVDDSPASVSHDDVLSEEDMQQITEQFNSVASQLDVFQRSMNEMRASMQRVQSELAGLQQRPQTPATALEQINEDVVAAKTTIKSLQANLKAALTRLDGDNTDIRNSLSTLQSSESDMAALRAAMSAEFHALRMEQAEVGRAANTLATVAIAVGLACIGLILFFHMM